jgi:anti-anti-sigma factor
MPPSSPTKSVGSGVAPDSIVVAITGELDMARDGELFATIVALDAPPGTTVDLEFSEVTFIDSRGLCSVFRAKAYLEGRGCPLRVVNPQQQFLRVLELTDLADALTVVDDGEGN